MKITLDNWQFRFNNSEWRKVTVPHDWAIERPYNENMECAYEQGFFDRWGIGEYETAFSLDNIDGIVRLSFDGVYENCSVYLNGQLVGGHKYGYSPFSFDITHIVRLGKNDLRVVVDNTTKPVDRWYSGCGIYRKVYIENLPYEHIERNDVIIITHPDGSINIDTGVQSAVVAQINVGGVGYCEEGVGTITLKVTDFEMWSADTPYLYSLKLTLKENGHSEVFNIGFRSVEISSKGFFVNGNAEKIKGVCLHQDASCFGTAVPVEIWRERLLVLKEYGVNALRLAHHLFMPEMLDLCDELGFYVYEECFDKWKSGLYERYYDLCWSDDIAAMVKRDRNRPSIIIWGVGNEVEEQFSEQSLKLLDNHCRLVKSLDNTRPVTLAVFPWIIRDCEMDEKDTKEVLPIYGEDPRDIAFRIKQIKKMIKCVDLIGCNYQEPWYEAYHKAMPETAILGTEIYQYFHGYPRNVNVYDDLIPWLACEDKDYVIGGYVWAGTDYLGESMGPPAKGWSGAIFTTDMEPKVGAYILRSYWTEKPFVHFEVMDYTVEDQFAKEAWDTPRYVCHWDFPNVHKSVVPYMVASNCEEVLVKLNDRIISRRKPADYKNRIVTGFIPYAEGTVTVVGINNGQEVCSHIITTPSAPCRLEFDNAVCTSDKSPLTRLLKVRAKDEKGNNCFREDAEVSFEIDGDGEIIGVDNGDLLDRTPYNSSSIKLHGGRASVAVRIWGKATVKAISANMKCCELSL